MKVALIAWTRGVNGEDPDQICGEAAALCTASDDPEKSLRVAMAAHHMSVLEHASFTFRVEGVSRTLMAQLTRHRHGSYAVQGQRYNKVTEGNVIIPPTIASRPGALSIFLHATTEAEMAYKALVEDYKIPKEDARFLLPEGEQCKIMMTMNGRSLREFLHLRQCNRAQWEIRQMADAMAIELKEKAPHIFKNAGPGCVTGDCPEGAMACRIPRV